MTLNVSCEPAEPSAGLTALNLPKKRMRIRTLQLGKSWFPEQAGSGLDRVYYALIQHLPRVEVGVSGLVAGSPAVGNDLEFGVQAFASDSATLLRRLSGMRKAMQQILSTQRFDVVASHFALYTFPIIDLVANRPLVVHFHGPWAKEGKVEGEHPFVVKAKTILEQMVYRRGVRFVVLSKAFHEILQTHYGIPEEHIRIIPGGVEADAFDTGLSREEARVQLGWPVDRPTMLTVRRLTRRMGLERLIEAMRLVRKRVPDALLYMAGQGPLANELNECIAAAGLEKHVKMLGFLPDKSLPLAFRAANFSVVPTVALEGFGLITVESLAAGTPVLVTPSGGLPEVVQRLSPALVFSGYSVQALSEHLVAALIGEIKLPSSAECQTYARTNFDWSVIAERTRNVYEEVLL